MRPSTFSAIKTLLRMDKTVTEAERSAIIAAVTDSKSKALARCAFDGAWLKSGDVCLLMDINRSTLARWIAAGMLNGRKRGKCWYVTSESVRLLMAEPEGAREKFFDRGVCTNAAASA